MELIYDKELSGKPGSETIVSDPAGHALRTISQKLPASGQNVELTLDGQIQYTVEKVLQKTLRDTGGKWAVSIVMDPRTGEIYAMANVTDKGFHGYGKDPEADKNRCVTDVYEPGSIFKLVTISGALADGTITPTQKFELPPVLQVADRKINESHPRGYVTYDVRQILQWSSNVGAVTIGIKMQQGGHGQVDRRLRVRQADRRPVPGRGGRSRRPGEGLVRLLHRQHPHGAGHRGDRPADGVGVLHGGEQRHPGEAPAGEAGRQASLLPSADGQAPRASPSRSPRRSAATSPPRWTRAPARRRGSPATRSPARPAPPRSPSPTAEGTPRTSTPRRSSAWRPPTIPASSSSAPWAGPPSTAAEAAAPAVKDIMQYSLQHLEIAP